MAIYEHNPNTAEIGFLGLFRLAAEYSANDERGSVGDPSGKAPLRDFAGITLAEPSFTLEDPFEKDFAGITLAAPSIILESHGFIFEAENTGQIDDTAGITLSPSILLESHGFIFEVENTGQYDDTAGIILAEPSIILESHGFIFEAENTGQYDDTAGITLAEPSITLLSNT
ncbi:hypothetical protein OAB00_01280 [Akkermansiaceae bacterium]|nr:hypothetical protein [Akkermansiaceae bacterium]